MAATGTKHRINVNWSTSCQMARIEFDGCQGDREFAILPFPFDSLLLNLFRSERVTTAQILQFMSYQLARLIHDGVFNFLSVHILEIYLAGK